MNTVKYFLSFSIILSPIYNWAAEIVGSADSQEFDLKKGTLELRGEATFDHESLQIIADEGVLSRKENKANAKGNVRLTQNYFRLVSDALSYDGTSKELAADHFRLGESPFYIVGSELNGTTEAIHFKDATIHHSEPSPWGLSASAQAVNFYPGDRIEGEKVVFRIGKFPFFYLPSTNQKLDGPSYNFDGRMGYQSDLGAYIQTETLLPINENLQAGPVLDYYTSRGVLVGPNIAWTSESPDEDSFVKSSLIGGFINDHGDKEFDILGRQVEEDRYFAEFRHLQKFNKNWSLNSSMSIWSDSEVERDFRERYYDDNQQPDSYIESVYTGDNYFISAFARLDPNDFQLIQERLPEVRFDMVPTEINNLNLYHSLHASFARLKENQLLNAGTDLKSDRFDLHYSLFRPIKVNNWLNVVPVLGARLTHYDDTMGRRNNFSRVMGEVGFDAEMVAHRTWDYQNKLWGIDGLRHIFRPVIRYRYLPGGKYGNNDIIPIDDEVLISGIPAIDLNNMRHIDDLTDLNVLRFGFENLFQTKDPEYGSRDLLEFNLYQDLRFSEDSSNQEWTQLYTGLTFNPAYWFSLYVHSRIDPENLTMDETQAGISITDGDQWKAWLSTVSVQHNIDQYRLDYVYKLNQTWNFRTRFRIDAKRGKLNRHTYALRQQIGNTWAIEYQINFRSGDDRGSDAGFRLKFDLLNF